MKPLDFCPCAQCARLDAAHPRQRRQLVHPDLRNPERAVPPRLRAALPERFQPKY